MVWLALVLWLVMCVGELGVVSQSVLVMYLWIALFSLPYFYRTCRHALDALVEETLLFVAEVVRGGARSPALPPSTRTPLYPKKPSSPIPALRLVHLVWSLAAYTPAACCRLRILICFHRGVSGWAVQASG